MIEYCVCEDECICDVTPIEEDDDPEALIGEEVEED